MHETMNLDGNYRIEISGWDLDSSFFVEQTDLLWDPSGDKKVFLHRALAEGAMVFIRLLLPESAGSTLPAAYQVAAVHPMDGNSQCEIRLKQLHPRTKVPRTGELASYSSEDSKRMREAKESSAPLEHEEILQ